METDPVDIAKKRKKQKVILALMLLQFANSLLTPTLASSWPAYIYSQTQIHSVALGAFFSLKYVV